jgi:hypothetical protein
MFQACVCVCVCVCVCDDKCVPKCLYICVTHTCILWLTWCVTNIKKLCQKYKKKIIYIIYILWLTPDVSQMYVWHIYVSHIYVSHIYVTHICIVWLPSLSVCIHTQYLCLTCRRSVTSRPRLGINTRMLYPYT